MILNQNKNFDEVNEQALKARYNETALEQLLENSVLQQRFAKIANKLCAVRKHVGMEAPEDIQQEIYLRIIEKIHKFRGEAKFTTWSERIAINIVNDQCKRSKRTEKRNEISIDDDYNNEDIVPFIDPRVNIETQIDFKLIKMEIEKLPPHLRDVLHKHFFEGKSFRSIAESSSYNSPQTAVNHLNEAIEMLRKLLKINFGTEKNLHVSKIH